MNCLRRFPRCTCFVCFIFFILIPPDYFFISAHSFSRAIVKLSRLPRVYVAATVLHLSPGRILEGRHGTAAAEGRGRRRRRWGGGWRTRGLAGASSGPFVVGMATPWRRGCSPKSLEKERKQAVAAALDFSHLRHSGLPWKRAADATGPAAADQWDSTRCAGEGAGSPASTSPAHAADPDARGRHLRPLCPPLCEWADERRGSGPREPTRQQRVAELSSPESEHLSAR